MSVYQIQNISEYDRFNKAYHIQELLPSHEFQDKDYHRHDYFEIMFFERGGGEHLIDFTSYNIENYNCHFVLPGQVHKLKRKPNSNGYVLLFSEEIVLKQNSSENILFELPFYNDVLPLSWSLSSQVYLELAYLLNKLLKELTNHEPLNELPTLYLNLCLSVLKRSIQEQMPLNIKDNRGQTLVFIKFKRLLEENFFRGLKPADYASQLGITTGHLSDVLKDAYNKTTGDLIHDRIILESKRLLFYTQLTVNEISYKVGFEDPSYFIRLFKKETKVTPRDYRVLIRQKS